MNTLHKCIPTLVSTLLLLWITLTSPAEAQAMNQFSLGVNAYRQHDYELALATFTQIIEQEDSDSLSAAYGNRCLIELELEAYQAAIADCTRSLQLNPTSSESYLNRGLAHYRVHEYGAAIEDYGRQLQQTADDYRAFYNRGLAQAGLSHYAQAIQDYTQAIALSPESPTQRIAQVYADRGSAYLATGEYQKAASDFSQTIAYDASNVEAYLNRAYASHLLNNDAAALRDLNRVLALDPTHAKTHFNLGMLRYQLGQIEGAIASFEQAAQYFFHQNASDDYARVMTILNQLQLPSAFG
ncbi:MAG: tetratricopeptide repeat protein [Elainellaceae cyanobacterium]